MFDPTLLDSIKQAAGPLETFIGKYYPLKKKGASYSGSCPNCGSSAFSVSPAKQVAKCFKCEVAWKDVISFWMFHQKIDFKEAVTELAKMHGLDHLLQEPAVEVMPPAKPAAKAKPAATKARQKPPRTASGNTFRDRWLAERGISETMQQAELAETVGGSATTRTVNRYTVGTMDHRKNWDVIDGPDMVMHYMGLDRQWTTYVPKKGTKLKPMVRVRFQNPELHIFSGKPAKYISPPGSGLHVWLPNRIIADYNRPGITKRPVLTIQEGEGKADRVCEVVPTVGITGIHALAGHDEALPMEFEQLVERFDTETIVFFMDADLFELGESEDKSVDQRPKFFASAAKKYRQHFHKFQAVGRRLNILLAHPTTLAEGIKGMDDLLESGKLTDEELRQAIEDGIMGRNTNQLLQFYDLTGRTDAQIDELWHLNTVHDFAKHYAEAIRAKHPDEFRLGKIKYRFDEDGKLVPAQQMMPQERFYNVIHDDAGIPKKVNFSNVHLLEFMHARGFYRFRELHGGFSYIAVEDKLVQQVSAIDMRDYVNDFLRAQEEKNIMVRNFFLHNYEQFLGDRTFSSLRYEEPLLIRDQRQRKFFTFTDTVWEVSIEGVKVMNRTDLPGSIWRNARINEQPRYVGPLFTMKQVTGDMLAKAKGEEYRKLLDANLGKWFVELTEEGEKCVFLQFLINSSNFYWEKEEKAMAELEMSLRDQYPDATEEEITSHFDRALAKNHPLTEAERFETNLHLTAKLTAMGHLLRKYRSPDADYGIFAMEGNMVEDMRAEGRSGKSLIPKMLGHAVPVVNVDGKKDMNRDIYVWDKVTPQTAIVNLDDVDRKFDAVMLYSRMTGEFGVRGMNTAEVQIPYKDAPLFYVSSNYNLLGNDGSTRDRWRAIAFSDFYSAERKPQDLHGHLFFDEWDDEEKSRFFTLLADCSRAYFSVGGVQAAPDDRLERRRWKMEVGQTFEAWADSVFRFPSTNGKHAVNTGIRIKKLEMLGLEGSLDWSFYAKNPDQRKYIKPPAFKRKLWMWALLNGYEINVGFPYTGKSMPEYRGKLYGGDIKQMGSEWVTITEPGQAMQKEDEKEDEAGF